MKNILIIRTDRLGDLLMNVPMIHRLKENYPGAAITLVCDAAYAPLFHYHLDVNQVIGVDAKRLMTWAGKRELYARLRGRRFDCAVLTQPEKFFHVLCTMLGIPLRVGYDRKWGFLLNQKSKDDKAVNARHEIDSNLALVDALCERPWTGKIDLGLDMYPRHREIDVKFGLREEKQKIVFHMTSSNPVKEWEVAKFRAVVEDLLMRKRYQAVFVGQDDGRWKTAMDFGPQAHTTNCMNRTSLLELAMVLRHAQAVVSVDSGPLHLAWMQDVPSVGIFFKEAAGSNPTRWGIYPGTGTHYTFYKKKDELEPAEVSAVAREIAKSVINPVE